MPLLNHFVPPLSISHPWSGFHSAWATTIATHLNDELLPARYYAIPNVQLGGAIEIDVAALRENGGLVGAGSGKDLTAWSPPAPAATVPVDFAGLETVEVQVFYDEGGPRLMAAIELVSPGNKDRPATRRAFVIKCANYLQHETSLMIVDIVTNRKANLHQELMQMLQADGPEVTAELYAVAYHPMEEADQEKLQIWPHSLALGEPLPTVPLWLAVDFSVPLDLEITYKKTCEALRIPYKNE